MYKIFISILCIVLIFCLPLAIAQDTKEVVEDVVTVSKFGESETTDLIINVNKYEPVVIISSALEEQNIPVYVFLSGIPTEGISLPRIQSVSVSVVGGNKSQLVGGIQYIKPYVYTWDDLGHLSLKLRKIEKEADIPDSIDVQLKAKIRYEAEVTSHLIGGKEPKTLKEEPSLNIERILTYSNYVFFGGKGRIIAERISGKTASFVLYSSEGERVSSFSVREGRESSSYRLVKGSNLPEDFVRIRVDNIIDDTQNSAVVTIDGIDHYVTIGTEILDWKFDEINITKFGENYVRYIKLSRGKDKTILVEGDFNWNDENYRAASSVLSKNINRYVDKGEFEILEDGFRKLNFGNFIVKDFKEGEKPSATFNLGTFSKGIGDTDCEITSITPNRVYIKNKKTGNKYTLWLMSALERERYYSRSGSSYTDTLGVDSCGQTVLLKGIDTKKKVNIVLLSGKKTGTSETTFWLHLPIEKRAIKLSPRALDKQINKTTKMIKDLDKSIIKLEKIVKKWRQICLVTTAAMLAVNLVRGLFGVGKVIDKKPVEKAAEKTAEELAKETAKKAWDAIQKTESSDCPGYKKLEGYTFYKGEDVYVYDDIPNVYYICKDKKISDAIKSPIIKKDKKDIIWDGTKFVEYTGVGGDEFGSIRIVTVRGKKTTIIPLRNPESLRWVGQQYAKWNMNPQIAGKSVYAVVFNNEIEFWVVNGAKLDVGDTNLADKEDNGLVDYHLTSVSKTGDRIEREIFKEFELKYLNRISEAQRRGLPLVELDGRNYKVDNTGQKFGEIGVESCEDVLSDAQCWFIYNACDPVICPASRCDLGGKAKNIKNVVQSGFVGSTILCLPNFFAFKGKKGVLVPFCISGWLASMKNYRSILKAYVACLTNSKVNGISTGICDKMTSIYYCQLIWQEVMSIFNLDRGLLGLIAGKTVGSVGKEGVSGISGAVKETTKGLNYFVSNYATNVFAAYRGRSTAQIGAEFCKSYTAGKLPNIGEFFEEISEPEDPIQYTAWFEEHPYAPTRGESLYKVWYHIYAGNPRREQSVRYKIYLRTLGQSFLPIAEGELNAGEYADEAIDKIGLIGYQQVCIVINGVENCNFGKIVSTSYMIDDMHGKWMRKLGGLAPNITMKEQCVSTQEGLTPSYIPMAAVERKCGISNPDLGLGEEKEKQWIKVGRCSDQEYCWQKMDLRKNPELRERTSEDICKNQGGVWCPNKKCSVKMEIFKYDDPTGHYECCLAGGVCVDLVEKKEENITGMKGTLFEPPEEKEKTQEQIKITLEKIKTSKSCEEAEDLLKNFKEKFKDTYKTDWSTLMYEMEYLVGFRCFKLGNYEKSKEYLLYVRGDYFNDATYVLGFSYYYLAKDETKNKEVKKVLYNNALDAFNRILSDEEYSDGAVSMKDLVEEELNKLEE